MAFAPEAPEEELALGGFASAVEAFNGNEGATAGRGGGGGHVWWNGRLWRLLFVIGVLCC